MNFWVGEEDLANRFSMRVTDFGPFHKWSDKTDDSTWSRKYVVSDHVYAFDSDWKEETWYKYPDWLWYDTDPPNPQPAALVNLLRYGFSASWPVGDISSTGYGGSFERLHGGVVEADSIMYKLRKVMDLLPPDSVIDAMPSFRLSRLELEEAKEPLPSGDSSKYDETFPH